VFLARVNWLIERKETRFSSSLLFKPETVSNTFFFFLRMVRFTFVEIGKGFLDVKVLVFRILIQVVFRIPMGI